jgi:hypothetical protein
MKRMMTIAVLALGGLIAAGTADARVLQPRYLTVQYGGFQQRGTCNINGVLYPVAMDYSVWAHDAAYNWYAVGSVSFVGYGIWHYQGYDGESRNVPCW